MDATPRRLHAAAMPELSRCQKQFIKLMSGRLACSRAPGSSNVATVNAAAPPPQAAASDNAWWASIPSAASGAAVTLSPEHSYTRPAGAHAAGTSGSDGVTSGGGGWESISGRQASAARCTCHHRHEVRPESPFAPLVFAH